MNQIKGFDKLKGLRDQLPDHVSEEGKKEEDDTLMAVDELLDLWLACARKYEELPEEIQLKVRKLITTCTELGLMT